MVPSSRPTKTITNIAALVLLTSLALPLTGQEEQVPPETLNGHLGAITAVNYTPSGELIVTSSSDTTVRLWQASSGEELRVLQGHTGQVTSVTVDPTGRMILSGAADNTIRLWDIPRADPLLELAAGDLPVQGLAIHTASGTLVSGGDDGLVRIWDLAAAKEQYQLKGHTAAVVAAAYRADANQLATIDINGLVRLWDPLLRNETHQLGVQEGEARVLTYHPNNQQLISAGSDGILRTWNLQVPARQQLPAHAAGVSRLKFSTNGQFIITSDGTQLAIYNTADRQQLRLLEGQQDTVTAIGRSNNDQLVASGNALGQLRFWNIADGADRLTVQAGNQPVSEIVFHPDNIRLTSSHRDGLVRFWKLPVAPVPLEGQVAAVTSLAIRPDGLQAVTTGQDMSVSLWNPAGGAAPVKLAGHLAVPTAARYRADGQQLATGDADGGLRLWNSADGAPQGIRLAHDGAVTDISYHPAGTSLLTASVEGTWKQWALPLVPPLPLAGSTDAVSRVVMAADGSLMVVGGLDKTVRIFNSQNGQLLRALAGHADAVTALALDLPGQLVVSGSEMGAIRLWNPADGVSKLELLGHDGAVLDLELLPAAAGIVSAGADGTIRRWLLPQPPRDHAGHTLPVAVVGSSADGLLLFSGGADKIVRLFNRADGAAASATAEHQDAVSAIAMNGDKSVLASGDKAGIVYVWPQQEGQPASQLLGHTGEIRGVTFSQMDKQLVSAGADGTLRWWALPVVPARQLLAQVPAVAEIAVSADRAATLVGAGEAGVVVITNETGAVERTLAGQDGAVTSVALKPDASLAGAGTANGAVQLWNVADGSVLNSFRGHAGAVSAVLLGSQPGQIYSAGVDGTIRSWQVPPDPRAFVDRQGLVAAIAFSADKSRVAIAMPVQERAGILIREVASGKVLFELLGHQAPVTALAFDATGNKVVSGSADKTLRVWDLADAKFAEIASFEHPGPVTAVSFNKDATQVFGASNDNGIHQWNLADNTEIRLLAGHGGAISSLVLFGDILVSGAADNTVRSWNVTNGAAAGNIANTAAVTCLALSPDGATVAAGSADNMIRLWNRANGQAIATLAGHAGPVTSVNYGNKGTLLISAATGELRVWNADGTPREAQLAAEGVSFQSINLLADEAGKITLVALQSDGILQLRQPTLLALLLGHEGEVTDLAMDTAGTLLVSGGMDKTVRQWNIATGEQHASFAGATDVVTAVSLAGDGTSVFAASQDKNAYAWPVPAAITPAAIVASGTFVSTMPLRAVSASADGSKLVTAGDDKLVTVWDVASGLVLEQLAGHTEAVLVASIAADGTTVISGGTDKTARLWNIAAQRVSQADVEVLAFTATTDGSLLVTAGSDKQLRCWDAASGEKRLEAALGDRVPISLAISLAGIEISVGDTVGVRRWPLSGAAAELVIGPAVAVLSELSVLRVAYDQQGRLAVVTADNKLKLVDTAAGQVQQEFLLPAPSAAVAAVPPTADGAHTDALLITNANTPVLQQVALADLLVGHEGAVTSLALNPDGTSLFSGGMDQTVRQWNLTEGIQSGTYGGPSDVVTSLALAADGTSLSAGSVDMNAYIWVVPEEPAEAAVAASTMLTSTAPIRAISPSLDGARLAVAGDDKLVTVWDVASGLVLEQLAGHSEAVLDVSLSSDGATLVSGSADKTASWWKIGVQQVVQADEKPVVGVRFIGDGTSMYTAGESSGVTRWTLVDATPTPLVAVVPAAMELAGAEQDPVTITATGIVQRWSAETGELVNQLETADVPPETTLALSVSADGTRAAVGHGNLVQLYDLANGELLETFPVETPVTAVSLTADAGRLLVGLNAPASNLFNFPVSALSAWRVDPEAVTAHTLSPNGQFLFAADGQGRVQMRQLDTGQLVRTFGTGKDLINRLAISSNNQLLAAASKDKSAYIWTINPENAADLAADAVVEPDSSLVHPAAVSSLDFSNNGGRLVTGCEDGRTRIWNSVDGMPLEWFAAHEGPCLDVDYKDDLAVASGGMDKTVQLQTTAITAAYQVFEMGVSEGELLANGAQLLVASDDGQLALLNMANGTVIRAFEGAEQPVVAMTAAADGSQLAAATADNKLLFWTINNGQLRTTFELPESVTMLQFSADNQKVAAILADGTIRVYDAGDEVRELYELTSDQPVVSLLFQDDNRHLVTGHANGLVRQWLYASPDAVKTFTGHGSSIYGLAFNHDSKIFASASLDQTIRIWDVNGGNQLKQLSGHQGAVYSVAFSPDGSLLVSCGADKTLRLWDVLGGRQLKQVSAADAGLYSVTMNADGKRVAVAGLDKKIRVFDLLTGELLSTLDRHKDFVYRISYNTAGDRLLSCGYGGRVIVWNAADGQPLFERNLNQVSNYADLSPDGSRIIIAGGGGVGHFVDVSADSP